MQTLASLSGKEQHDRALELGFDIDATTELKDYQGRQVKVPNYLLDAIRHLSPQDRFKKYQAVGLIDPQAEYHGYENGEFTSVALDEWYPR